MTEITEQEAFCDKMTYHKAESSQFNPTGRIPQPVLLAFASVNRLFSHPEASSLFLTVARKFKSDITEDELKTIFKDVHERGCDVFVKLVHKGAIMQVIPFPNILDLEVTRPQLLLNPNYSAIFIDTQYAHRQEYIHIIKIIHEYVHMMVPHLLTLSGVNVEEAVAQAKLISQSNWSASKKKEELNALSKKLDTPPKIGSVLNQINFMGDAGSEWEELTCGGRIIPNMNPSKPYNGKVLLLKRQYAELPPTHGNQSIFRVNDDYITQFLNNVHGLDNNKPFPLALFAIPSEDTTLWRADLAEDVDTAKASILGKRKHVLEYDEDSEDTQDSEDANIQQRLGSIPIGSTYGVALTKEELKLRYTRGAKF